MPCLSLLITCLAPGQYLWPCTVHRWTSAPHCPRCILWVSAGHRVPLSFCHGDMHGSALVSSQEALLPQSCTCSYGQQPSGEWRGRGFCRLTSCSVAVSRCRLLRHHHLSIIFMPTKLSHSSLWCNFDLQMLLKQESFIFMLVEGAGAWSASLHNSKTIAEVCNCVKLGVTRTMDLLCVNFC